VTLYLKFTLYSAQELNVIMDCNIIYVGARGSVVGFGTMLQVVRSSPDEMDFLSIYLILPAALWLWGRLSL
jgi:hypothetical protein